MMTTVLKFVKIFGRKYDRAMVNDVGFMLKPSQ